MACFRIDLPGEAQRDAGGNELDLVAAGVITWQQASSTLPFVLLIVPLLYGSHRLGQLVIKPAKM